MFGTLEATVWFCDEALCMSQRTSLTVVRALHGALARRTVETKLVPCFRLYKEYEINKCIYLFIYYYARWQPDIQL